MIVYDLKEMSYDNSNKASRITIMLYKSTLHFDSMFITQLKVSHPKQSIERYVKYSTFDNTCI